MKLDRNRSYGQTYGHPYAVYEQDGHLFDGQGNSVSSPKSDNKRDSSPVDEGPDDDVNRSFLLEMLKEGPVRKESIYKECQLRGLSWEDVSSEAAQMDIYAYDYGVGKNKKEMWKLGQD